jgi:cysteinyl-tRNA synthetase
LGNFITLKQVFSDTPDEKHDRLSRKYDPLAVRQLILNSHYRSPIDFSDAALFAAQSGYEKITETVLEIRSKENFAPKGTVNDQIQKELNLLKARFEDAMGDDLNTSVALSVVFDTIRLARQVLERSDTTKETLELVDNHFRSLGGDVLGIVKESYGSTEIAVAERDRMINVLVKLRTEARERKDYNTADMIRNVLNEASIVLIDNLDGTTTATFSTFKL